MSDDLQSVVQALTDRVERLEALVGNDERRGPEVGGTDPTTGTSATIAPDGSPPTSEQTPHENTVTYQGSVDLAGPVRWRIGYDAAAILDLPAATIADVFAAMGHPSRLEILRILLRRNASVAELQAAGDFGTSGQLYHHLKILTAASLVVKAGRNEYGVAATHVVPILVAMLSAGDIGGVL
ncbi:helix-turn-helix domain-containing protein [Gordonia sp. L191]|uniref:ArsR/SmtB family transcription factor n=1 Tax=Gordonia sp. L191 TaxID=2982699 RepID=UPI0024C04D97|nr:helix-turn-helix domain-containing protein [Gordonia sp. L191]WHU45082.1 helix-turn-helix domain-containing protein [Gordonia sp. L191]